ncbi:DUF3307 domain-containing protein [Alkalibaculum sp. M08DMB]|uniref:DUF3307 domain-containing protein n=1 Tax=Alkalibaculum sporogenes TaxID=2655001 RepID=A0A6A7K4B5_9FIRM|nr:DUF3307 domain-containing protein [Alkalibaculum sporogenes]MPW24306.1 DUF3307 domain-containing protein [Alkalibaculum sporogenes]
MFKEYFVLLLLGHILGDFYIQTNKMAQKKEKSLKWVLIHCLCYGSVMLMISIPIISLKIALAVLVAAILHLVIDVIKFVYILLKTKKDKITLTIERNIFFVDQALHFVCLFGITYWGIRSDVSINAWKIIKDFLEAAGVSEGLTISWVLALLVIHKPANIVIQKLLMIYKPESNDEEKKKDNNAGRFIGTVERVTMLIFLSIGQYSAIGLVLTAKSIARYDKISKEKDFAEYYLLGTLISTIIVIVSSFII